MNEENQIVKQTSSHLYTRKGYKIENISNRLVGIVWVNYRKNYLTNSLVVITSKNNYF